MMARRKTRMRRLIDTTVDLVGTGLMRYDDAVKILFENGVPVAVIGRVLGDLKNAKPPAEVPDDLMGHVENDALGMAEPTASSAQAKPDSVS